jgi:hypothetical protein
MARKRDPNDEVDRFVSVVGESLGLNPYIHVGLPTSREGSMP